MACGVAVVRPRESWGDFVDVGDVGGVGGDGAGEDLALLEEADFFYVAVEVVGEHGDHAGDQGWAEEGGFFGEGVLHGDGSLPSASVV